MINLIIFKIINNKTCLIIIKLFKVYLIFIQKRIDTEINKCIHFIVKRFGLLCHWCVTWTATDTEDSIGAAASSGDSLARVESAWGCPGHGCDGTRLIMSHMPVTGHTCLINSDGVGLSDGLISSTFLYFVIML